MNNSLFLYPNIATNGANSSAASDVINPKNGAEFDAVLENTVTRFEDSLSERLKFSGHAIDRMRKRNIQLDPDTMLQVKNAIDKAAEKGVEDALVITNQAALIVNTQNRTVVTAMDLGSLKGSVFTNIDGAVIV